MLFYLILPFILLGHKMLDFSQLAARFPQEICYSVFIPTFGSNFLPFWLLIPLFSSLSLPRPAADGCRSLGHQWSRKLDFGCLFPIVFFPFFLFNLNTPVINGQLWNPVCSHAHDHRPWPLPISAFPCSRIEGRPRSPVLPRNQGEKKEKKKKTERKDKRNEKKILSPPPPHSLFTLSFVSLVCFVWTLSTLSRMSLSTVGSSDKFS